MIGHLAKQCHSLFTQEALSITPEQLKPGKGVFVHTTVYGVVNRNDWEVLGQWRIINSVRVSNAILHGATTGCTTVLLTQSF